MPHLITRDITAQVQGPGWSYGLARVLIDDQGQAAVFVPPGLAPVQTFQFTTGGDGQGFGETEDGGRVTYRRRGTSCQFKLARCHAETPVLAARWDAADAGSEPAPVEEVTPLPEIDDAEGETETETVEAGVS